MKKAAIFLILFIVFAGVVWGQQATFTWTGDTDNNWEETTNWEEGGSVATSYPGKDSNDDIVIINNTSNINISSDVTIYSLEINSVVTIATSYVFGVSDTLTNTGTLNFNGVNLSAGVLTNSGTLNFSGTELSAGTLTNNSTLNFNGNELSVIGTLTNIGILDLDDAKLTVGALTNTGGLIKLQGSQDVIGAPPGRIGGTIQYQGNTPSPWPFGYSYTDLIIDSSSTMGVAGALDISGNADFGSVITAASLTVNGNSTINANITTTGNQTYGNVTLDALVTLTSSGGNITINQTGNLQITSLQTTGASGSISIKATGEVTQTGVITTSSLTVEAGTGIMLNKDNNVENVTLKSNALTAANGNIVYNSDVGELNILKMTTDTLGNITITEKTGGLNVEEINKGNNIELKAYTGIITKGITVSGSITMEAGGDITVTDDISFSGTINANNKVTLEAGGKITVTDDITAYQLIAITKGVVTVKTVNIKLNTGDEGRSAAIYIEAADFEVTAAPFSPPYPIVPGGTGGQLCLNLDNKWEDTGAFVDGCEKGDPLGTSLVVRWHQHFIDLSGMHLLYGDELTFYGTIPGLYIHVSDNNVKTKFLLDSDKNVYINNVSFANLSGLTFETSGDGTIKFSGVNNFTNLTLKADTDITLESINTLSGITVETAGTIKINQDIETTGMQKYSGSVELGGNITLTSNTDSVTLGNITGSGKSLTIDGNGVLNGGNGIENLSVSGTATINADIETSGTQEYMGEITLGGSVAQIKLEGTTVTLKETITGSGKSLTIDGNSVLNGGSGINDLSVSGTATINADITSSGTQEYKEAVTLGGDVTLTSTVGAVTLGAITGSGKSLTIDGNGVLNGGNDINDLSVSETATINASITSSGTQEYKGAVTLGGSDTLITLDGTTVTLGAITGGGKSLTITGNSVLNGGSGINDLSVSGTATINADITTTGNQIYTGAATVDGSGERVITSDNGNIEFSGILNSLNVIKLLAANGNITVTDVNAYQLIAITKGVVTVKTVKIDLSNTGNEGDNAAIYIVANDFIVEPKSENSIVPGGAGGQLCLNLNKKWRNSGNVVDGAEDKPDNLGSVSNARWHQHFVVVGKILYSFTEDSNGNGRLDRIRVQTNKELNGDFSDFVVSVSGYDVVKEEFKLVNNSSDNDSFYIYLTEKYEFDGGNCPDWKIEKNTSLKYKGTSPEFVDNLTVAGNPTIDTIPPRIAYTLTLPGRNETYVQMSEPLASLPETVSFGSGSVTVNPASPANLGYLFNHSSSYGVDSLARLHNIYNDSASTAGNGYFQMSGITDKAQESIYDSDDPDYEPKYPLNWGYTEYATKSSNADVLIPPNKLLTVDMMTKLANKQGASVTQNTDPVTRRVTDVLVSMIPNAANDNYFAWPMWAKPSGDSIHIDYTEFDGSKYLDKLSIEKQGVELQARINDSLTVTPKLLWTTKDIPADMRNPKYEGDDRKIGGLWLPNVMTNPLYYYVPLSNGINPPTPPAANPSGPLFIYDITAKDLANSGAKFEFIFRLSDTSDMFVARLDAPPNTIPGNWYTLIRPFGFCITGVRYQRDGVTIMNNVINSDNKETAIIRYDLQRAGRVTIQIYTLDGTLVKSIRRNENREAGVYVDSWDGSNNGGRAVARGMYFVRVVGPDIDEIRKIMVVK
jgi:hypothetical protein